MAIIAPARLVRRMQPMEMAAMTFQHRWNDVQRWFPDNDRQRGLTQAAKAKARGCRSTGNLQAIIYLIAGKLDIRLPT